MEDLSSHNADLRSEIDRLHAECERVGAENASITVDVLNFPSLCFELFIRRPASAIKSSSNFQEELKKLHGPAVLTALGVD